MRDGAVGLSTSLQYAPAPYAKTEELIALAAEAAKLGGTYASHIRDEGDGIDAALDEAFRIGREANIPVEIWHLKAAGKANWGRMPRDRRAHRGGAEIGYRRRGRHLRLSGGLQLRSPPSFRRGRTTAATSKLIERLKDPAMRARIRKEMETPVERVEQRVAAGDRPGVVPDRRRAESQAAAAAGQDHRGDREALEQGPDRYGVRPADRGRSLHAGRACS